MKKIIILIVVGVIFLLGCGAKKEVKTNYTVAIDSGAISPSNYKDKVTGEILGFEAELMREIAKRGNFRFDFVEQPFSLIIKGVTEGKTDMGVGFISMIDERKKILKFSEPYMETIIVLLANKNNKLQDNSEIVYGIAKGTYFKSLIENKKTVGIIEEVDTNKVIEKLLSKDVDYAITSKELGDVYIIKHPEIYEERILNKDLIGIAFNKNTPTKFINKVNNVISEMKSDGSLDNLKKKYGIYKEN